MSFREDIPMQQYKITTLTLASARSLALAAALLVSSAVVSHRASAQDMAAPPPSASADDSARADAAPSSVWNAQRVRRVIEDGTQVVLTDGTIWEVYLPDRPDVKTWKPGDLLVVREAAVMQGEYDYTIKDGRTRKPVWVRLVGDVSSRS
jgi:hypothetical protein